MLITAATVPDSRPRFPLPAYQIASADSSKSSYFQGVLVVVDLASHKMVQSFPLADTAQTAVLPMPAHRIPYRCSRVRPYLIGRVVSFVPPDAAAEVAGAWIGRVVAVAAEALPVLMAVPYILEGVASCTSEPEGSHSRSVVDNSNSEAVVAADMVSRIAVGHNPAAERPVHGLLAQEYLSVESQLEVAVVASCAEARSTAVGARACGLEVGFGKAAAHALASATPSQECLPAFSVRVEGLEL